MHRPGGEGDPSSSGTGATKEAEAALGTQRPPALLPGEAQGGPSRSYQPPRGRSPPGQHHQLPRERPPPG